MRIYVQNTRKMCLCWSQGRKDTDAARWLEKGLVLGAKLVLGLNYTRKKEEIPAMNTHFSALCT